MRVAALYDIHGNLPALEAVLAEVREAGVELVVVGGDVIPGPMPTECLALLRSCGIPVRCLRGNGDREVLTKREGKPSDTIPERFRPVMAWVAAAISDDDARWIAGWPATVLLTLEGIGGVLFCHATPRNDMDLFTSVTPEGRLRPHFAGVDAAMVVCGHTHMQFDRTVGGVRVVNAGSVGMPFGEPGAYWLLLDGAPHHRRSAYDLGAAAERIRATAYPQAAEFADGHVLHPPAAETMRDTFEQAAIR
jgi:predicted phosphodiesterase